MAAADTETDAAEGFAAAWDDFVLALRRSQARSGSQPSEELTLAQYYLLVPLVSAESLPVSRLAQCAGISAPTATRIADGLDRAGVITRERCTDDRRTVLVSLTAAGRAQFKRRQRQLARRRRLLYERLEPSERECSERLLRHLAELISEL